MARRRTGGRRFLRRPLFGQERGDACRPPNPSQRPVVVIMAHPGDKLAGLVSQVLAYDDVPVWKLEPHQLLRHPLRLRQGVATIEDQVVRGLLLRAAACLEADDEQQVIGRLCGDPVLAATWLAAASLASVQAINCYDADAWRRGAGWSVWVSRLGDSGVPVFCSRDRHPSPAELATSLVVCGEVIDGPRPASVATTARVLRDSGVQLATVHSLVDGTVSGVDTQPRLIPGPAARRAAIRVSQFLVAA